MPINNKTFNIVVTGCGGQGVITLTKIISQAALLSGLDVKMSEVHGLAQRGGHLECHVKFGKAVHSSLVPQGDADLIIALEPLEALRCLWYASSKTQLVINTAKIIPIAKYQDKKEYPSLDQIVKEIKPFTKKIDRLEATKIVEEAVKTTVPLNIYMLGYAFHKKFLPLKKEKLLESIKTTISEKYFDINKKVFDLCSR